MQQAARCVVQRVERIALVNLLFVKRDERKKKLKLGMLASESASPRHACRSRSSTMSARPAAWRCASPCRLPSRVSSQRSASAGSQTCQHWMTAANIGATLTKEQGRPRPLCQVTGHIHHDTCWTHGAPGPQAGGRRGALSVALCVWLAPGRVACELRGEHSRIMLRAIRPPPLALFVVKLSMITLGHRRGLCFVENSLL